MNLSCSLLLLIEYISILSLLLLSDLFHVSFLIPYKLRFLLTNLMLLNFLSIVYIFLHFLLLNLSLQDTLVTYTQVVLSSFLLFRDKLTHLTSSFFTKYFLSRFRIPSHLLGSNILFHVLVINLILFLKCSFLGIIVPLSISIKWVI